MRLTEVGWRSDPLLDGDGSGAAARGHALRRRLAPRLDILKLSPQIVPFSTTRVITKPEAFIGTSTEPERLSLNLQVWLAVSVPGSVSVRLLETCVSVVKCLGGEITGFLPVGVNAPLAPPYSTTSAISALFRSAVFPLSEDQPSCTLKPC